VEKLISSGASVSLVGGDGAGFLAYLFGDTDMGEPAPTRIIRIIRIMWKN